MRRLYDRIGVWLSAAASVALPVLRRPWVRGLGLLIGVVLIAIGLLTGLQRVDFSSAFRSLGLRGLALALALGALTTFLSALGWALIVDALTPHADVWRSLRSYFAALPLKYIPGSVWNHFGRAAWLAELSRLPPRDSTLSSSGGSGAMGVALDFGWLLWSGMVATGVTAMLNPPRALSGVISRGGLVAIAVMLTAISAAAPFVLYGLPGQSAARSRWGFAIRLWSAHLLQILSWLAASALLGYLVANLSFNPELQLDLGESALALFAGISTGLAVLFVPNGIGVREWVIGATLSHIVPVENGFAAGILHRMIVMSSELLIFLVMGVQFIFRRPISRD